jgi:hypothetical protein
VANTVRTLGQLGIVALLAAVLSFSIPIFVDSHQFAESAANYARNPNPENAAVLRGESSKKSRIALTTHLQISAVLFIALSAGWLCWRHRASSAPE